MQKLIMVFLVWICAPGLFAQTLDPSDTAANLIEDWRAWAARNDVGAGAIAISYQGEIITTDSVGRNAEDPAPLASLSKAVTAVCAMQALDVSEAGLDTEIGDLLADAFERIVIEDARLKQVTIGELVTHTSGIDGSSFPQRMGALKRFSETQQPEQFAQVAAEPLMAAPGERYSYANANYLILGMVIEALTGQDYASYCYETTLRPAGVGEAYVMDNWAVLMAYGGWAVSAVDYLKFAHAYFGEGKVLGQAAVDFEPKARGGEGFYYGPGVFLRPTPVGVNVWHAGAWDWRGRKRTGRFGAYFAIYDNGFGVSVNHDIHGMDGALGELDSLLYRGTHPE